MSIFSLPACVIAFAAGVVCLFVAWGRWKWSLPGSGYKGITRGYWMTLYALVIHGLVFMGFAVYCVLRGA